MVDTPILNDRQIQLAHDMQAIHAAYAVGYELPPLTAAQPESSPIPDILATTEPITDLYVNVPEPVIVPQDETDPKQDVGMEAWRRFHTTMSGATE